MSEQAPSCDSPDEEVRGVDLSSLYGVELLDHIAAQTDALINGQTQLQEEIQALRELTYRRAQLETRENKLREERYQSLRLVVGAAVTVVAGVALYDRFSHAGLHRSVQRVDARLSGAVRGTGPSREEILKAVRESQQLLANHDMRLRDTGKILQKALSPATPEKGSK